MKALLMWCLECGFGLRVGVDVDAVSVASVGLFSSLLESSDDELSGDFSLALEDEGVLGYVVLPGVL